MNYHYVRRSAQLLPEVEISRSERTENIIMSHTSQRSVNVLRKRYRAEHENPLPHRKRDVRGREIVCCTVWGVGISTIMARVLVIPFPHHADFDGDDTKPPMTFDFRSMYPLSGRFDGSITDEITRNIDKLDEHLVDSVTRSPRLVKPQDIPSERMLWLHNFHNKVNQSMARINRQSSTEVARQLIPNSARPIKPYRSRKPVAKRFNQSQIPKPMYHKIIRNKSIHQPR